MSGILDLTADYRMVSAAELAAGPGPVTRSPLTYDEGEVDFPIFEVSDAFVVGRVQPVSGVKRGDTIEIFKESSDYDGWAEIWWKNARDEYKGGLPHAVKYACTLALPINFGHWHQEALPKVLILERSGFDGVYIVADNPLFVTSLQLFGIPAERICKMSAEGLRVERLLMPRRLPLHDTYAFANALRDTRARCLAYAGTAPSAERLYIARKPDSLRAIVNDDELTCLLSSYGFAKHYMEDYSLPEQIGIAASASTILGPHGAGMACTMFMKEGGSVFELFSPNYINPCVLPTCSALHLAYFPIVSSVNPPATYAHGESIVAYLELLRYYLARL